MSEPDAVARDEHGSIGTAVARADRTIDPRTGEPRRPWTVWAAAALHDAGVALVVAGLLWAFWTSIRQFATAAWLNGVVPTEPGSVVRVLMVTGLFATAMVIGAASLVTGYYAWKGYGWTRWAGLVASVLSAGALIINPLASWGIAPIVLGSALLWLPATRAFFARWHTRRHPVRVDPTIVDDVFYGPLPRYR